MQSQRTHRKNTRLSRFTWTKYAKLLVKICYIVGVHNTGTVGQMWPARDLEKARNRFTECIRCFSWKTGTLFSLPWKTPNFHIVNLDGMRYGKRLVIRKHLVKNRSNNSCFTTQTSIFGPLMDTVHSIPWVEAKPCVLPQPQELNIWLRLNILNVPSSKIGNSE